MLGLTATGDTVVAVATDLGHDPSVNQAAVSVSQDGGDHWSEIRALPPVTSRWTLVMPDAGHWWWGSGGDGIWTSADQGRHWTPAGSPPPGLATTDLRFSSDREGRVLAGAADDGPFFPRRAFVTHDGGRTWAPLPLP